MISYQSDSQDCLCCDSTGQTKNNSKLIMRNESRGRGISDFLLPNYKCWNTARSLLLRYQIKLSVLQKMAMMNTAQCYQRLKWAHSMVLVYTLDTHFVFHTTRVRGKSSLLFSQHPTKSRFLLNKNGVYKQNRFDEPSPSWSWTPHGEVSGGTPSTDQWDISDCTLLYNSGRYHS